ncbi:WD-40 repeat-containing protein [Calothrix sp. NIES-4071]|nr:WD-40 repeat-containing protein [Calothrix sp. NIES-4071]BAZ54551.1 WD-40 repeat-containing protein [Calothrix sp. NIES-4105]
MNYKIGATLSSNASSYIERQSDAELYNALKQGQFCYVLNCRQMGKSSLMVRTRHRLQQEGFKCTTINMTNIGSENLSPPQWYKGILTDLWSSFNLRGKIDFKAWWEDQEGISLHQKLSNFIVDVLLVQFPHRKIIIFIDEIDSVLNLDFSVDDFFVFICYCYYQRAINPIYKQITFALFGTTAPSELIKDKNCPLFNISQFVELNDFKIHEAQSLAQGLNIQCGDQEKILQEILYWTSGQPFLTQKLCQLVAISEKKLVNSTLTIFPGAEASVVATIVNSRIIENWEFQDKPEHLITIRTRILSNEETRKRCLEIYQQILYVGEVAIDDSQEQMQLLLSGLVIKKQGKLQVKNPIYKKVFNQKWILKQLYSLHSKASNFNHQYLLK